MAFGKSLAVLMIGASCAGLVAPAPARSAGVLYPLVTPPSGLDVGCEGPCTCAVTPRSAWGSFTLVPAGADPLFTYYDVQGFIASFWNGPGAVSIVGSGTYRIGGEVALEQEMTLDLQIEGGPTQHFDSGLVPVGATFPAISVSCALHGFACFDSVVVVDAAPPTAGVPPTGGAPGLERVAPNPFRTGTRIVFRTSRAGPVDLEVFDIGGRRVRALARGDSFPPGESVVVWDGRRDDGAASPAGVYWVRLASPDGPALARICKLE